MHSELPETASRSIRTPAPTPLIPTIKVPVPFTATGSMSFEPLVELDYAKKAWVGVLAESWEFQGKRWVFKLKKGIKFHNGAPLTSKDVAFSVEKMRDEKGGSLQAPNFSDVTEIQTPDDQTVVFVTKEP